MRNFFGKISENKLFFKILKWTIFVISLLYVGYKILKNEEIINVFIKVIDFSNLYILLFLLLLMLLNLSIEAIKFQYLTQKFIKIYYLKAIKAIFLGIGVSVVMPNRTGEFAGRLLVVNKQYRIKTFIATIISGYAQFLTTIIAGTAGIIYFALLHSNIELFDLKLNFLLLTIVCIVTIILLLFYFRISILISISKRITFLIKYINHIKLIKEYSKLNLLFVLLFSVFRYFVFVYQFFLIINFFNININFIECFAASSITFYLSTLIPTFALSEISVRGAVASIVFEVFTNSSFEIIVASVILWVVNIGLPAVIGNIFLISKKHNFN